MLIGRSLMACMGTRLGLLQLSAGHRDIDINLGSDSVEESTDK